MDESHAVLVGSQRQIQHYVNEHPARLDAAITARFSELEGTTIQWRSPLADKGYAEYRDIRFLEAVDQAEHASALKRFWPAGGPRWDALAVCGSGSDAGVILVEGKSHVKELRGAGCKAKPGSTSRQLIEHSFGWTQNHIGVTTKTPEDWCGPLYQSANRLAFLCWLRAAGVDAWLVHVLFTGDPIGPTDVDDWETAMSGAEVELGIGGLVVVAAGHIVLPALDFAPASA